MKAIYDFLLIYALVFTLVVLLSSAVGAQTTSFTYQGRLSESSLSANGTYDMQFALFDAASGGSQIGSTETNAAVSVVNGIFTVNLDFGVDSFSGPGRYLQLAVRAAGSANPHTLLTPRQPVTSAPYSIRSLNADTAATATNSTQLGGINADQYVTGQVVRSVNNLADNVTLAAGSNITITPAGNTLTIASTGGGGTGGILNQTSLQSGANFNIDGNGTLGGTLSANAVNSATQYNIGGSRVLGVAGNAGTFAGVSAGTSNTGGSNSFFGTQAGQSNTSGNSNSFFGANAGVGNTTGFANSFFGSSAGVSNTTGRTNAFFGVQAGQANTTGFDNAFFGIQAGFANTIGTRNSFFGRNAGAASASATENSFFGADAGLNTIGGGNSFFGANAGKANVNGLLNSFFGRNAGALSTGDNNSFFGTSAGAANTTGGSNAFFGTSAGILNTTGDNNTFVGRNAGVSNTLGNNNTLVGSGANVGVNNLSFATAIGAGATVNASDQIVIGRSGGQDSVYIPGYLSIGRLDLPGSAPLCASVLVGAVTVCSSSLRYKENVAPFTSGLSLINRLRPVTYDWKSSQTRDIGFIAEEVAEAEPLLATYNEKGQIEGVKYGQITTALVNAVKDQQAQIDTQQKQFQQQQLVIDSLKKLVCRTNAQAEECREEK